MTTSMYADYDQMKDAEKKENVKAKQKLQGGGGRIAMQD